MFEYNYETTHNAANTVSMGCRTDAGYSGGDAAVFNGTAWSTLADKQWCLSLDFVGLQSTDYRVYNDFSIEASMKGSGKLITMIMPKTYIIPGPRLTYRRFLPSTIPSGDTSGAAISTITAKAYLNSDISTNSQATADLSAPNPGLIISSINTASDLSASANAKSNVLSAINTASSIIALLKGKASVTSTSNTASVVTALATAKASGLSAINSSTSLAASLKGKVNAVSAITSLSSLSCLISGTGYFYSAISTGNISFSANLTDTLPPTSSIVSSYSNLSATLLANGYLISSIPSNSNISGDLTGFAFCLSNIDCSTSIMAALFGINETQFIPIITFF